MISTVDSTELDRITAAVAGTPFMSPVQAAKLWTLIHEHELPNVLELGFAHGVSTCYLAAAVAQLDGGRVTTIDQDSARTRSPSIEDLLTKCGLQHLVQIHYEPQSLTWRLMRMIESPRRPVFDFVYLDAGHTWDVTGFAFFLVDKLLRPGGWLVFDDLPWTYGRSPSLKDKPTTLAMPKDYRTTPQVQKVFELLVQDHPSYDNCRVEGSWGFAQKRPKESGELDG
jgi:predicted O-methyltransferase YrrM